MLQSEFSFLIISVPMFISMFQLLCYLSYWGTDPVGGTHLSGYRSLFMKQHTLLFLSVKIQVGFFKKVYIILLFYTYFCYFCCFIIELHTFYTFCYSKKQKQGVWGHILNPPLSLFFFFFFGIAQHNQNKHHQVHFSSLI